MPNELGSAYPEGYEYLELTEMLFKDIQEWAAEYWDERFETFSPSKEHLDIRDRTIRRSFLRELNEKLQEKMNEGIALDIKAEEEGRDRQQEEAEGKAEGMKNTQRIRGPYHALYKRARDGVKKELEEEKAKYSEVKAGGGKE
ncbi:MAG: hypothetical protein Q9209_002201 [Squamulea sp. 1 TL-2023]